MLTNLYKQQQENISLSLNSCRVKGSGYAHMFVGRQASMFWKLIMCVFLSLKEIYLLLLSRGENMLTSRGDEQVPAAE
jgi:hypothetical protein